MARGAAPVCMLRVAVIAGGRHEPEHGALPRRPARSSAPLSSQGRVSVTISLDRDKFEFKHPGFRTN